MLNLDRQRPDVRLLVERVVRRSDAELWESVGLHGRIDRELEGREELQRSRENRGVSVCEPHTKGGSDRL